MRPTDKELKIASVYADALRRIYDGQEDAQEALKKLVDKFNGWGDAQRLAFMDAADYRGLWEWFIEVKDTLQGKGYE